MGSTPSQRRSTWPAQPGWEGGLDAGWDPGAGRHSSGHAVDVYEGRVSSRDTEPLAAHACQAAACGEPACVLRCRQQPGLGTPRGGSELAGLSRNGAGEQDKRERTWLRGPGEAGAGACALFLHQQAPLQRAKVTRAHCGT